MLGMTTPTAPPPPDAFEAFKDMQGFYNDAFSNLLTLFAISVAVIALFGIAFPAWLDWQRKRKFEADIKKMSDKYRSRFALLEARTWHLQAATISSEHTDVQLYSFARAAQGYLAAGLGYSRDLDVTVLGATTGLYQITNAKQFASTDREFNLKLTIRNLLKDLRRANTDKQHDGQIDALTDALKSAESKRDEAGPTTDQES